MTRYYEPARTVATARRSQSNPSSKIGARSDLVPGTGAMFAMYLAVLVVEYGGLTSLIPVLKVIRFSTVLSYVLFIWVVVQIGIKQLMPRVQTKLLLAFLVFTILSVLWAVVRLYAFQSIRPVVDYIVLFALTAILIDRQSRVDALSWVFLGVCAMLVVRNLDKLSSGVRSGSFAAPYFMGDGNDFAWSMVTLLPFLVNLLLGERKALTRLIAVGGVVLCLIGIVGTGSRGAAIGLGASLLFYWFVISRKKALGAAALVAIVAGVLVFAPSEYVGRVQSVTQFQKDNSAQGRLQAWKASIQMAIDRPLGVGAGNFASAYGRFYMPAADENALQWASQRWISPHSIYFKVLGEYGIIGLMIILGVIIRNFRDNNAVRRAIIAGQASGRYSPTWPGLLNMSLIGYAVCGAFLGGISQPHLFLLSGLTVALAMSSVTNTGAASAARPKRA